MPLPDFADRRSRSFRAAKGREHIESALPSPEHTVIGYCCRDCTSKKIYATLDALLTHCGLALRKGLHRPNSNLNVSVARGHPSYKEQHIGNLFAVVNFRPQVRARDDPSTRIFIPLNSVGDPINSSSGTGSGTQGGSGPGQRAMDLSGDPDPNTGSDMYVDGQDHDADMHMPTSSGNQNISQPQPPENVGSFAAAVQQRPDFQLKDVLEQGIHDITLASSQSAAMDGWCNMISRWQALREHGLHTVRYRPQCRPPPERESGGLENASNPFNISEVLFLETTKDSSIDFRDKLLRMMRDPVFDAHQISWNSTNAMVRASLKNHNQVELCEGIIESREFLSL